MHVYIYCIFEYPKIRILSFRFLFLFLQRISKICSTYLFTYALDKSSICFLLLLLFSIEILWSSNLCVCEISKVLESLFYEALIFFLSLVFIHEKKTKTKTKIPKVSKLIIKNNMKMIFVSLSLSLYILFFIVETLHKVRK